MLSAEIIFKNSASRFNRDLTDFLERNLKTIIIKAQIKFHFKTAGTDTDISQLRARGITRLPCMIIQKQHFVNPTNIIEELGRRIRTSRAPAKKKSDDEQLDDYFREALGNITQGVDGKLKVPDDREDEGPDLGGMAAREMTRRKESKESHFKGKKKTRGVDRNYNNANHLVEADRSRPAINSRADNLDVGDPVRMLKQGSTNDVDENGMLATLFERMGGDHNLGIN